MERSTSSRACTVDKQRTLQLNERARGRQWNLNESVVMWAVQLCNADEWIVWMCM